MRRLAGRVVLLMGMLDRANDSMRTQSKEERGLTEIAQPGWMVTTQIIPGACHGKSGVGTTLIQLLAERTTALIGGTVRLPIFQKWAIDSMPHWIFGSFAK